MIVEEGSGKGHPEGMFSECTIKGDVPPPVCYFVAMFTRVQTIKKRLDERNNRAYTRCGKLVLGNGIPTKACKTCAGKCLVCRETIEGGDGVPGKMCKSCGTKRNFCGRCGDPLRGSKEIGFLCGSCGIGSLGNDCCKMKF